MTYGTNLISFFYSGSSPYFADDFIYFRIEPYVFHILWITFSKKKYCDLLFNWYHTSLVIISHSKFISCRIGGVLGRPRSEIYKFCVNNFFHRLLCYFLFPSILTSTWVMNIIFFPTQTTMHIFIHFHQKISLLYVHIKFEFIYISNWL